MKDKTGGPAFPVAEGTSFEVGELKETQITSQEKGMTLLDYFACKAMREIFISGGWSEYENLSKESYEVAAAMLKEREKWME